MAKSALALETITLAEKWGTNEVSVAYSGERKGLWSYRMYLNAKDSDQRLVLWDRNFPNQPPPNAVRRDDVLSVDLVTNVRVLDYHIDSTLKRVVVVFIHGGVIYGEIMRPGKSRASHLVPLEYRTLPQTCRMGSRGLLAFGKVIAGRQDGTYEVTIGWLDGGDSQFAFDGVRWNLCATGYDGPQLGTRPVHREKATVMTRISGANDLFLEYRPLRGNECWRTITNRIDTAQFNTFVAFDRQYRLLMKSGDTDQQQSLVLWERPFLSEVYNGARVPTLPQDPEYDPSQPKPKMVNLDGSVELVGYYSDPNYRSAVFFY